MHDPDTTMSREPIPAGPHQITPEWLTAVLRETGAIRAAVVTAADVNVIGQDRGFTGVVARVGLCYDRIEDGAPPSLVAKLPMADRAAPSAYRATRLPDTAAAHRYFERCAREVAFYHHIASDNLLPVPRLYYGAADNDSGRIVLLLEDLGAARSGDALLGCSPRAAALVVEQMAAFHARWWERPLLRSFAWLPSWSGDSGTAQARYNGAITPFLERFGRRVPAPVHEIIDNLAASYGAVRSVLVQAPVTLLHGDLHLDNVLFGPQGRTPAVTIVDWQSVSCGRGVVDLALFLVGSLEIEARRASEPELLRRYHDLLADGGVSGYTHADLRDDYRLALLWQLGATVAWLGSVTMDNLSGRERALVDAAVESGRLFAAVLDHDAGALLPL